MDGEWLGVFWSGLRGFDILSREHVVSSLETNKPRLYRAMWHHFLVHLRKLAIFIAFFFNG